ncbi:MAG: tyrosine-protein phosphatase [Thermoanaerobaculales bacterium]|nr:tyrosine-protein phosphatase [Thermoanaerobaculales bacterium]
MKRRRVWICVLPVLVLVLGGWWFLLQLKVGEVIPSRVFRSPQLSAERLRRVIRTHDIGIVVNLRGTGRGKTWYGEELAVCAEEGVDHHTVTFDMDGPPPRHKVVELVDLLESTQRPILFHCLRGVDRSGWAAALAVLADGGSLDEGLAQLSPMSGHFCRRSTCPQHRFFASYEEFLNGEGIANSAGLFRFWVDEVYCPDAYDASLEFVSPPPSDATSGTEIELAVRVRNRGRVAWRMGPEAVRLGARGVGPFLEAPENAVEIFRIRGAEIRDLGRSAGGLGHVSPGSERLLTMTLRTPEEPGLYVIQVDMVHEFVHWFSEMGRPGPMWFLTVEDEVNGSETTEGMISGWLPARRAAGLDPVEALSCPGRTRCARRTPEVRPRTRVPE